MGYSYLMLGQPSDYLEYYPFKLIYDCPSKQYELNYDIGTFTDEEMEIFNRDNYCQRLYYEGLIETDLLESKPSILEYKAITKEDWSNAVLLPISEDFITCAYGSFDFKLKDGSTKHLTSCIYISKSSFDTKEIDDHLQNLLNIHTINGIEMKTFKFEINDKNGKSLKYDSENYGWTSTSSSSSTSGNIGHLIGIPKLLSLILIISLL